jgi:alpha-glucosidase
MLQPDIPAVLARIRRLMEDYPGTATLGEVSSQDGAFERIARYTSGADHLHMAYTLQPLRGVFDRPTLLRLIRETASGAPQGWIAWSFSNHDVERAVTRWGPNARDPDFARLLMGLLLSLRGSPCVYQGEELGLPESLVAFEDMRDPFGLAYYPEYRGRDGSRTPFPWRAAAPHAGFSAAKPWLPVEPLHVPLSVDRQEADPHSVLLAWRRFLTWRKTHPALVDGALEPATAPPPLIAFRRRNAAESLLIVLNTAAEPAGVPTELVAAARPLDGHGFPSGRGDGGLVLPRYGMFFGRE